MMDTCAGAADALGRWIPPAEGAVRIVSLVPSITELCFALDLADHLVGRTGFCIHPQPQVRRLAKVGGTKDVDLRALRALAPTHVLVNIDENERPVYEALCDFVPQVIVTHPIAVEDNLGLYHLLGEVFGRQAQAAILAQRLRSELQACDALADLPWRRVLYLIWKDPWMTIGPDTFIARMLAKVRLEAVSPPSSARYPVVDWASLPVGGLDAVLLSSEPYRFTESHRREMATMPALAGVPMHLVDGEMSSWYGVRAIQGLAYLRAWRQAFDAPLARLG